MNAESWITILLFGVNLMLAGVGLFLKAQSEKRRQEIEALDQDVTAVWEKHEANSVAINALRLQLAQDYFHKIETTQTVTQAIKPLADQLVELKSMVNQLLMRNNHFTLGQNL